MQLLAHLVAEHCRLGSVEDRLPKAGLRSSLASVARVFLGPSSFARKERMVLQCQSFAIWNAAPRPSTHSYHFRYSAADHGNNAVPAKLVNWVEVEKVCQAESDTSASRQPPRQGLSHCHVHSYLGSGIHTNQSNVRRRSIRENVRAALALQRQY